MGCEELIESLRKQADEKIREVWRKAEEEAVKIRAAASLRLETLRLDNAAGLSSQKEIEKVFLEADNSARMIRLTSENRLFVRLYSIAFSYLGLLREKGYEDMFRRYVLELPPFGWQVVQVNPNDLGLAKKFFPGAEIVAEREITGGMEAEAEEGRIRVTNTFEKRLERIWPQMLPGLLDDIYREVMKSGTPPGI
jgi:V/A-type H+/Na+-transporting ATPase subunit E